MKRKKAKIASRRRKLMAVSLVIRLLLSATALAAEPNPQTPELKEALTQMRQRQQAEEGGTVVRMIQQPVTVQTDQACSLSERVRQRIRDLGGSETKVSGSVNVEAGHGEVKVDDNHGSINNSVNVQINTPGGNDRKCF